MAAAINPARATSRAGDMQIFFENVEAVRDFLGLERPFSRCHAFAPYALNSPHCSRPTNRAGRSKVSRLLANLTMTAIPSRTAAELLEQLSRCSVCGITGWHQNKAKDVYVEWVERLWIKFLHAHSLSQADVALTSSAAVLGFGVPGCWETAVSSAHGERLRASMEARAWRERGAGQPQEPAQRERGRQAVERRDYERPDRGGRDRERHERERREAAQHREVERLRLERREEVRESRQPETQLGDSRQQEVGRREAQRREVEQRGNTRGSEVTQDENVWQLDENPRLENRRRNGLLAHRPTISVYRDQENETYLSGTQAGPSNGPFEAIRHAGRTPLAPLSSNTRVQTGRTHWKCQIVTSPARTGYVVNRSFAENNESSREVGVGNDSSPETTSGEDTPGEDDHLTEANETEGEASETDGNNSDDESEDNNGGDDGDSNSDADDDGNGHERAGNDGLESLDEGRDREPSEDQSDAYWTPATESDIESSAGEQGLSAQGADDDEAFQPANRVSNDVQLEEMVNNLMSIRLDDEASPNSSFQLYPQQIPTRQLHELRQKIHDSVREKSRWPGYIYGYRRMGRPSHIKIGMVFRNPNEQDRPLDQHTHPVDKRLARWSQTCGYVVEEVFRAYMPCAVSRIESLVHQHLRAYRRVELGCACSPPARFEGDPRQRTHDEWFEIAEPEARAVVALWQRFSQSEPYDSFGRLKDTWCLRVEPNAGSQGGHGPSQNPHAGNAGTAAEGVVATAEESAISRWVIWFLGDAPRLDAGGISLAS